MAIFRNVKRLSGRSVGALLGALLILLVSVGVAQASSYTYFQGNSCCSNRQFSPYINIFMTKNSAGNGGGYVQCVQERVYPAGGGSFLDGYKCQPGSVSHALNGASSDQAICWINASPSPLNSCVEDY